jgi:hypothetical protein
MPSNKLPKQGNYLMGINKESADFYITQLKTPSH